MSAAKPAARSSRSSFQLAFAGGVAVGDEPDERLAVVGERDALGFEGEQQAFEAAAESDAGGRSAAELFDEVVVPPAAADRVLRAEARRR